MIDNLKENNIDDIVKENVIIVMVNDGKNNQLFDYRVKEINNLASAINYTVLDTIIQNLERPNSRTFVGSGKLDEIKELINALEISTVIFEKELSPAQIKNIEEILKVDIIDRTMLILKIFELRAKTKEAVLQVAIAKYKYMMPRLIGSRNYLSRTGGGASGAGGARRGSGETKLELDKRHIENNILKLEKELETVVKNRAENRKKRKATDTKVVAFVGYTNAGKSSTINNLINLYSLDQIKKEVFVKDMLFATLETSTRKIKLPNNHEFLITDTVGFVCDLPHHLVESFKSTLEEIKDADLIVHIIDSSSPDKDVQIATTLEVLHDIGVRDIPILNAYNKIDLVNENSVITDNSFNDQSVFISANTLYGYNNLVKKIDDTLFSNYHHVNLLVPYDNGTIVNQILNNSEIETIEYTEDGVLIIGTISNYIYNYIKSSFPNYIIKDN